VIRVMISDQHRTRQTTSFIAARPRKRSLTIAGHRTSISLEEAFWDGLKEVAARDDVSLADLVARIDTERGTSCGLSSAIRVHVFEQLRR